MLLQQRLLLLPLPLAPLLLLLTPLLLLLSPLAELPQLCCGESSRTANSACCADFHVELSQSSAQPLRPLGPLPLPAQAVYEPLQRHCRH